MHVTPSLGSDVTQNYRKFAAVRRLRARSAVERQLTSRSCVVSLIWKAATFSSRYLMRFVPAAAGQPSKKLTGLETVLPYVQEYVSESSAAGTWQRQ